MEGVEVEKRKEAAVEEALGAPAGLEFPDHVLRIRRNLLFISSLSIFYILSGIKIDSGASVVGFQLSGLDESYLKVMVLFVLSYLLVTFLLSSMDTFACWRLRLTGTRLLYITGAKTVSDFGDYPSNPKSSSLYKWWMENIFYVNKYNLSLNRFIEAIENEHSGLQDGSDRGGSIGEIRDKLSNHNENILELYKYLNNGRLKLSIKRFDNWFQFALRAQNLRWFLVDMLFPVALSIYAVCFLISSL